MLDNLRKQERLSPEEEERIDSRIRIVILVMMAVAVAVIIFLLLLKKTLGTGYYVGILTLLAVVWILKYVVSAILKHSLAQRTDKQVSAYLKAAALEFVAYVGLGWFLVAMQGNAILGAAVYVFGLSTARSQRDIYYQEDEEEDGSGTHPENQVLDSEDGTTPELSQPSGLDALPSAADRQQREEDVEDGSV